MGESREVYDEVIPLATHTLYIIFNIYSRGGQRNKNESNSKYAYSTQRGKIVWFAGCQLPPSLLREDLCMSQPQAHFISVYIQVRQ